jgi:hypothetical protein
VSFRTSPESRKTIRLDKILDPYSRPGNSLPVKVIVKGICLRSNLKIEREGLKKAREMIFKLC